MFSFFNRKKRTPKEEFEKVLLDAFDNLKKGISQKTELDRRLLTATAFGSLISTLNKYYPNVSIEDGCVAIDVMKNAGNPDKWDEVEEDLDFVADQITRCSKDPDHRFIVIHSFFAPQKTQHVYEENQREQ